MYRVGVIGVGRIAAEFEDNHIKAYIGCKDTQIVTLCDTNIGKAYDCAERYGLKVDCVECIDDMPDVDIVSICTRPELHHENLFTCISRFNDLKAIYCEKPIATTIEEAEDMIGLCKNQGVILQINHQRRFGRPTASFARGMENTGTHMFDLLRMYFGDIKQIDNKSVITPDGITIDINEIQGGEHTFEFKVPPHEKGLIRLGVEHLVECIKEGKQSKSSGEDGLEALRLCQQFSQR